MTARIVKSRGYTHTHAHPHKAKKSLRALSWQPPLLKMAEYCQILFNKLPCPAQFCRCSARLLFRLHPHPPTHPPTRGGTMDSALHSVTEDCTSRSPLPIIQLKIRDNCRQLHNCHDSGGCSDVWHELVTLRWRQKYSLPQSIMPRQLKWIVRTGEGSKVKIEPISYS